MLRPGAAPGAPPRVELLPVSVAELAGASPAPAPDGSLLLASSGSAVFVLDAARGALLRTLGGGDDSADGGGGDDAALLDGAGALPGAGAAGVVAIGRRDYTVRAVHPAFGEQWNVTWARLHSLAELEVRRPPPPGGASADAAAAPPPPLRLAAGAGHSLARFDAAEGWELWRAAFDAPPLAAYPPGGGRIDLLLNDAAVAGGGRLAVGVMGGGLYGMPAPPRGAARWPRPSASNPFRTRATSSSRS